MLIFFYSALHILILDIPLLFLIFELLPFLYLPFVPMPQNLNYISYNYSKILDK